MTATYWWCTAPTKELVLGVLDLLDLYHTTIAPTFDCLDHAELNELFLYQFIPWYMPPCTW